MPSLTIPVSGLSLGSSQSSANSHAKYPDIFGLTLSDTVIENMIKCVRSKNGLQLSLGNDPVSKIIPLTTIHLPLILVLNCYGVAALQLSIELQTALRSPHHKEIH
jgi:hypothetical protein